MVTLLIAINFALSDKTLPLRDLDQETLWNKDCSQRNNAVAEQGLEKMTVMPRIEQYLLPQQ